MKERPILFSGPMVRALLSGAKTQTRRIVNDSSDVDAWAPIGLGEARMGEWRMGSYGEGGVLCEVGGMRCPYGVPGDRLWVRETWAYNGQAWRNCGPKDKRREGFVSYAADGAKVTHYFEDGPVLLCPEQHPPTQREDEDEWAFDVRKSEYFKNYFRRWRPSIHMPRWASRITLEVTEVRVERLQAISEKDAIAEGIERSVSGYWMNYAEDGPTHQRAVDSFRSLWESINGAGSWASNPWVWVVSFRRLERGP